MSVKLVSQSVGVNGESLKDLIVYCARVSNPSSQVAGTNPDKLLNYLMLHKHWSPFEMVTVCMEINTTRDIARQILRHRSFSFQEFSQRYADPTEIGWQFKEARLQDQKNRQNSIETDDEKLKKAWVTSQKRVHDVAVSEYMKALDSGIAKEQARAVLPEGLTNSRMYMTGSIRSWIHYIELRESNGTQKEHQQIALECRKVIEDLLK